MNQAIRLAMPTEESRSLQSCGKFLHKKEAPCTAPEERENGRGNRKRKSMSQARKSKMQREGEEGGGGGGDRQTDRQ